jgi:hypothetical protein
MIVLKFSAPSAVKAAAADTIGASIMPIKAIIIWRTKTAQKSIFKDFILSIFIINNSIV